jgi:uncharacterized phage protein (TIGR02218 family)
VKTFPGDLTTHLSQGLTTLCRCWKLTRRDGTTMGFTDFDRDLSFDGVDYLASSGFAASAIESQLGLAVSNLDVRGALSNSQGQLIDVGRYGVLGLHAMELDAILSPTEAWRYSVLGLHALEVEAALSSDVLTEGDLHAGRYDDAEVIVYLVNWSDTEQRGILRRGHLGQVSRGKVAFSAEVRGLAARLDQPAGRILQRSCPWTLGDGRCKVNMSSAGRSASGTVIQALDSFEFTASGLAGLAAGALTRGKLVWTTGENSNLSMEIRSHVSAGGHRIALMLPMGGQVSGGDQFIAYVGCDKALSTCRDTFANAKNFGGFPHIPGNDFALSYPNQGDGNDGGALT